MAMNRKVVWKEGMLLTPQHFQQWDRYLEDVLAERWRIHAPFAWGVMEMDNNRDGLATGRFTLLRCTVVMPDGLIVDIPEADGAPPTRAFTEFFHQKMNSLGVYLGISSGRKDEITCQLEEKESGPRPPRFLAEPIEVIDTTRGDTPRVVHVAKKNLKIVFSGEDSFDMTLVKIAELVRLPTGVVGLKETYIPPCVWVGASAYLKRLLKELIELLLATQSTFSDAKRGPLELIGTDLGKFALMTAVSTHLPVLQHLYQVECIHPESLYLALVRLAGQLHTLSAPGGIPDLPAYQHENLSGTFEALNERIRFIVHSMGPKRPILIPLVNNGNNMWVGRVVDSQLVASGQFYIAASGEVSEDQICHLVLKQVKVASPGTLTKLLQNFKPGLPLHHKPRPPAALPMKSGTQYFQLDTKDALWNDMIASQLVGIYVPETVKAIEIQLMAVKE